MKHVRLEVAVWVQWFVIAIICIGGAIGYNTLRTSPTLYVTNDVEPWVIADEHGTIVDASAALAKLVQSQTIPEMIGEPISRLIPQQYRERHGQRYAQRMQAIQQRPNGQILEVRNVHLTLWNGGEGPAVSVRVRLFYYRDKLYAKAWIVPQNNLVELPVPDELAK